MDYRMFGIGSPSEAFLTQLRGFCELDDVQREALAVWFESTSDFNFYPPELPQNILASSLLPDQFRDAVAPIRHIVNAWEEYSLELADIQRDLLLCGFSAERIELITKFLERLSSVKKRVWADGLEGTAQVVALPTIDDAHIVWGAPSQVFKAGSSRSPASWSGRCQRSDARSQDQELPSGWHSRLQPVDHPRRALFEIG